VPDGCSGSSSGVGVDGVDAAAPSKGGVGTRAWDSRLFRPGVEVCACGGNGGA